MSDNETLRKVLEGLRESSESKKNSTVTEPLGRGKIELSKLSMSQWIPGLEEERLRLEDDDYEL